MKYALMIAAALLVSACETIPSGATAPSAGPALDGQLGLGEWRTTNEAATLAVFERNVSSRYRAGLALSDAVADLRRTDFGCGSAPPQDQGRGDPPAQVCRRTLTHEGCTHTWQVHVFAESASVSRARGLYDRRCGNEGLLGGPG